MDGTCCSGVAALPVGPLASPRTEANTSGNEARRLLLELTLVCCEGSAALGQTNTPAQSTNILCNMVFDSQSNQARLPRSISACSNGGRRSPTCSTPGPRCSMRPTIPNTGIILAEQLFQAPLFPTGTASNFATGEHADPMPRLYWEYCPDAGAQLLCTRRNTGQRRRPPSPPRRGFQMNAAYSCTDFAGNNTINDSFPAYFDTTSAPLQEGLFWRFWGARPTKSTF